MQNIFVLRFSSVTILKITETFLRPLPLEDLFVLCSAKSDNHRGIGLNVYGRPRRKFKSCNMNEYTVHLYGKSAMIMMSEVS